MKDENPIQNIQGNNNEEVKNRKEKANGLQKEKKTSWNK